MYKLGIILLIGCNFILFLMFFLMFGNIMGRIGLSGMIFLCSIISIIWGIVEIFRKRHTRSILLVVPSLFYILVIYFIMFHKFQ
jgi:hypothetical protein